MSDEDAFRLAIYEAPNDDVPRLHYADWLDEQGDPRGELIRLQVRLSSGQHAEPDRNRWESRERELLLRHHSDWIQPLLDWGADSVRLRKGLLEVTIPIERFVAQTERLPLAFPACIRFQFNRSVSRARQQIALLADSPRLSDVYYIDLSRNGLTNRQIASFLRSPNLNRLTALDLSSNLLAAAPSFSNVLEAFAGHKGLRHLNLSFNFLGPDGAGQLANSPHFAELATLNVAGNQIETPGAVALTTSRNLANLRALDLSSNCIWSDYGPALSAVSSRTLPALAELRLEGNPIGRAAQEELRRRLTSHDAVAHVTTNRSA